MRNKLNELIVSFFRRDARYYGCDSLELADHLIANGVTLRQWIPVSERLPDTMNDVLCWYEYFRFGEYQRMFQTYGVGFCVSGMWGGEVANGYMSRVLYWMPLPEPPQED